MKSLVVVNNPKDWNFNLDTIEVVSAKSYLTDSKFLELKTARIFNLCRSYKYQATGYYVSLLAEARGHKAFPNIATIQDLKSLSIIRIISEDLDELIQKSLSKLKSEDFYLSIYFGQNVSKQYEKLSTQLYNLFKSPLMRAHFVYKEKWILQNIFPVPVNEIPENHLPFVEEFAKIYFSKKRIYSAKIPMAMYDLGILINPDEKAPPSDKKALKHFMEAAEEVGIRAEFITKDDFSRVPEFDALFIRETTAVNHYTYRFSRRAFTEGLVVIDDPRSILKCTNKVYLAEILTKAKIPIPKTVIVHKDNKDSVIGEIGLPCVLKKPDSSFSQGVVKVSEAGKLKSEIDNLMETSDLIIAQAYMYSEFDWRIGVLDKQPLFACKYFMAKGHWQIYNWENKKNDQTGKYETVPIYNVPKNVVKTALKAANLIGDGLYGVDIKQIGNEVYVIEVNDNPSIDAGVEDEVMGEHLYLTIMKSFKERIEILRNVKELHL
ncbi:MAG: RimK family protein [Bacteroidetes bacterium]|nr:RimK family protein [Bacteroidota bacterium]